VTGPGGKGRRAAPRRVTLRGAAAGAAAAFAAGSLAGAPLAVAAAAARGAGSHITVTVFPPPANHCSGPAKLPGTADFRPPVKARVMPRG